MLSKIYMLLAVVFTVMPFVQLLAGGFNSKAVALYWLLFAGYHVFVLFAVGNEDYFNYSTFGGAGFLFEDTKLLVLVYLSLFLIFFNIKIPKFTPVSCGLFLPLSSIIILFICIPAYFEYYNFLANSVKNGGYYNLYLHSNGNYLINFLSKYLPIILCILFFATNSSKSLHIVFLFPMLISHLPVLLTGQRTAFVLMMFCGEWFIWIVL